VAQTGQTILINDVARDPRYDAADTRTRSELCAPLLLGERVIGMINVESDQLDFFTTADSQLLQTLAQDLSAPVENLRLLEELRAANEQLTEINRRKNQFVANVSHELRTPLNAILGFGELLVDEVTGSLNDEQRSCVQHIDASGQHLLELVNDLLDLSQLQADRMVLERRTVDFADIVTAAQIFVWPGVQRKRQILIIDVPPDLPSLFVDPLRVKQVLINLLVNACKFTPPEGRIFVRAEVWQAGWLRASISDTGSGISPDKQAEVFEEFAQLNREWPMSERGSGLGLAIVRRLIELHGGQIWIDSTGQPGQGATFYFTLPLADAADVLRRTMAPPWS
jgi:Amt family ammonium transporter